LCLHSKAVLLIAIRKVTLLNSGRNTPGIDGFKAISTEERAKLFDTMKNMNIKLHKPKPAYRRNIRKKNGKYRSLGIPVIVDRIYQEIIRIALEPQFEVNFESISYGFRPRRGCHDATSRIMENIMDWRWSWIFEGDFEACFDTLSHNFILNEIKGFPAHDLVEKFLKAGYVDNNCFYNTDKGTPQGGILSPLLANIALNGLESVLKISHRKVCKNGLEYYMAIGKYRVVRYADDFVIFARSKKDIEAIYGILEPYLEDRGLKLAEDKTKISHISDGFDFLGFNFRRYKNKKGLIHLSKPSKSSIKAFTSKVDEICKELHGHNVDTLIDRLNPLIRGVANYWKPNSAKKIFYKMDYFIWQKIFKFIKRLHPNKSLEWLIKTYFPTYKDGQSADNWILTGPKKGNTLIKMGWTPIKRHEMIEFNNSPYDKSKEEYFHDRSLSC
jgi:RNA-directed DNA polymerase